MKHTFFQKKDWTGRDDGAPLRVHQFTETQNPETPLNPSGAYALLGFAVDEGVRRNQGRIGAAKGPPAFRKALANLPVLKEGFSLLDCGDISCPEQDLEAAQTYFQKQCEQLFKDDCFPFAVGGGHEIALPHYRALANTHKESAIGIINFDAHLDIRAPLDGKLATSGSSFYQIYHERTKNKLPFHYLCLGAQRFGNTVDLWRRLKEFGGEAVLAEEITWNFPEAQQRLTAFMSECDLIYLTICLDVFSPAYAPGVSAPSPLGIAPLEAVRLLRSIARSGKVKTFNIAELNPQYDVDDKTAKLAALITMELLTSLHP
ncbi:formimidoylglutamase [Estrella lausannensis]|uniref:Formimidoylglutamase n=1 Tax=Estrella lausannensis TaxID=483423 RepID=A0A0H5DPY8_9BACT|nr:formimidoylglutamase [Estrella lausannensis]CRX38676.1 Formimidoylglutamase [Estrella lausannensis]